MCPYRPTPRSGRKSVQRSRTRLLLDVLEDDELKQLNHALSTHAAILETANGRLETRRSRKLIQSLPPMGGWPVVNTRSHLALAPFAAARYMKGTRWTTIGWNDGGRSDNRPFELTVGAPHSLISVTECSPGTKMSAPSLRVVDVQCAGHVRPSPDTLEPESILLGWPSRSAVAVALNARSSPRRTVTRPIAREQLVASRIAIPRLAIRRRRPPNSPRATNGFLRCVGESIPPAKELFFCICRQHAP